MTDERDPRLDGMNYDADASGGRAGVPSAPRTVSGRFPAVSAGRGVVPGGRFSQAGMAAVPRAGVNPPQPPKAPSVTAAAPAAAVVPPRGAAIVGARGGRPGIVPGRGARPAVHAAEPVMADNHVMADSVEIPAAPVSSVSQEIPAAPASEEVVESEEADSLESEAVSSGDTEAVASDDSDVVSSGDTEAVDSDDNDVVSSGDAEAVDSDDNDVVASDDSDVVASGDAEAVASDDSDVVASGDAEAVDSVDSDVVASGNVEAVDSDNSDVVVSGNVEAVDSDAAEADEAEAVVSDDNAAATEATAADDDFEDDMSDADDEDDDDMCLDEEAADKGPAFEIKPIPPELSNEKSLRDNATYRKESRSLSRAQDWAELVQLMHNVLTYAPWAELPEVRGSILKEMAVIYAERLNDSDKERETYAQLLREDPANETALEYMDSQLRQQGDFKAIHAMYRRVVDVVWDGDERLHYTRKAAEIAEQELNKPKLVIADWEHLWELGEQGEEVRSSLMTAYREHACWEKLAAFMREKCVDWGTIQRLGLREVIEIYISGLSDADRASETLQVLLKDRPKDPLLLLQEINICRINSDVDKLAKISRMEGLDKTVELDIHRAAAEVLWDKGERELAVEAYDAILQDVPNDRDALNAKEQYYRDSGRYDELCEFYIERAEAALAEEKTEQAVVSYRKAADVAETLLFDNEKAIELLKHIVELDVSDTDNHRKIIALYEAIGDDAGVAASMEALLALTSRPAVRRELLAKLGGFYLDKLDNYERAEDCWKKVQTIDPRNPEVSEELSRVYAKQGDFESLDNSLTLQLRVTDDENILKLAESKGRYLTQHSPGAAHTAAGWEIVLDYDANHVNALENLSEVLEKLHRESEMMGAWEQELKTLEDKEARIELGLRIADACVEFATHTQAVAAYLRVLCWDPMQPTALSALASICNGQERAIVRSVLERAATIVEDNEKRCEILKRMLQFIPAENVLRRIQVMRRILILGDRNIVDEFVELCRTEKRSDELCAAWLRRASETTDAEERHKLLFDIARYSAEDLGNPSLAFTVLFAAALDADKAVALAAELEKLAPQTNRWEEVVSVLGCLASAVFDEEQRRVALEKRIDILLNKLDAPNLAMEDYARLMAIHPDDEELLGVIERLAEEKGMYDKLLGIYGEIWDATKNNALRSAISAKRHEILKNKLSRGYDAVGELFVGYRLKATDDVEAKIIAETSNDDYAALCVAMLESEKRAADEVNLDALKSVADLYETRLNSVDGAFALYSSVLTACPADTDALDKLAGWSGIEKHSGRYAQTLRLAASKAHAEGDIETSLAIYRRLANFYKNTLNDLERSIDIERKILRIKHDCVESLEALMAWHESREEWNPLRSEIKQRIMAGGTDDEKIALWLRVVSISSEHLNDLEGAFDGYAEILQINENNEDARAGIAALTGADIGPEVELRRLKLELKLAETEKRPEIMLQIAELQNEELNQPDAACETLEALYKETGACGVGYEPLKAMYEKQKSWQSLVEIMLAHADMQVESDDDDLAIETLNGALLIVDEKIKNAALSASIVEKLQKLEPDNAEIVERYCSSLRNAEDWPKYAETIKDLAGDPASRNVHKNHLFELARIQALALNDIDASLETYRVINKSGGVERNAYLGMASMALKKGDVDLYLSSLDLVLRVLDPVWGAIFYCHMAEVCDEKDKAAQVATYYRSARALDANNVEASDSLRSIGRRLKNWRATSALLPVENEREMSWAERSDKLVELAKKADSNEQARNFCWKAIAVNHDNVDAWRMLAKVEEKAGRLKERYEACMGAYGAVERTTLPGPSVALKNARLLYEVSQAASACGNDKKAEALIRKAYAITPNYAPVAIAIGDLEQDSGNIEKAYTVYDAILKNDAIKLDDKTRGEVLFKRGLISNIQQNYENAIDDLRATVKMSPLHYDALMTIAKTYAEMKQPLLALSCLQQSLLVTPDHTKRRGNTYYDMGKLWDDVFHDADEAGIYYEGALNNGASNVDLIERSLVIYKKAGRFEEALELVDTLTKTTSNPAILASLWCTRGELSESISSEKATEAYDMALSYQPGMARAFDGLERMLMARQEWERLADLLDGRLESELTKEQEAAILIRLADLYGSKLNKQSKAAKILYRLLESAPSADVIERLMAMPQDDPEKAISLREKAIVYCDGAYHHALELAQNHLAAGRELQTWAIMSPLRALLQLEPQTKETLNDLKGKFEKTDSIPLDSLSKALPILTDEQFAMLDAIQAVHAKLGTLGAKKLDEVTSGATEVAETTPNGKIFEQMRVGLEMENISLWRSTELPEPIVILNTDPVIVCIRTEIFQKAAGNELQFWLAKALGLAHNDVRTLASTPEKYRHALPKAILVAAGIGDVTPETAELVGKIKNVMTADELKALYAQLTELCTEDQLKTCAETFTRDMLETSDMLGAYVVADMRTVWRAESRIDTNITEQRNVKTIDEISKAIEVSNVLRKVLAYYVSSTFTDHIA